MLPDRSTCITNSNDAKPTGLTQTDSQAIASIQILIASSSSELKGFISGRTHDARHVFWDLGHGCTSLFSV
eukprot:1966132-Amphidinium_carterae.1